MEEMNKKILDLDNYHVNNTSEAAGAAGKSGRVHSPDVAPSRRRSSLATRITLVGLALALTAVAGYDSLVFKRHNVQLAQLPGMMDSLTGVSKRLDSVEADLRTWAAGRDALFASMAKLDHKLNVNLKVAHKQAEDMIAQVQISMEDELSKVTTVIDSRLSRVESNQQTERARLAQLQQEVASVRQEIAAVRKDTGSELSSLGQQQTHNEQKLEAISSQLNRQKVDFELTKNDTKELVPGISLRILRTDARYQRFAGWLWFMPDRRTLWIEDQGALQPIALRPQRGGEPYEVVVTRVNKHGVTGYLLVPTSDQTPASVSAAGNAGAVVASRSGF